MISRQGLSSEYKQTGKAMHYCWRESIEVHCNTKTQMQSLSTDTWGKKKCMYIFWGILKPLEPLICQSSIQPVLCTIKTNQVNRNKIKHNSFIPLNMVTEQTCWQKAANTEGGGGDRVCLLVRFHFSLSQPHSFAGSTPAGSIDTIDK